MDILEGVLFLRRKYLLCLYKYIYRFHKVTVFSEVKMVTWDTNKGVPGSKWHCDISFKDV